MKKYLITLDVNGTLLNTDYRSTSPTINGVIDQLQKEGHTFILNSNRAFEDLDCLSKLFGIKGPIITENGCFISKPNIPKHIDLVSLQTKEELQKVHYIIHEVIKNYFPETLFFKGDSTDINKHLDIQEIPENKKHIFIMNEYRRFTISIHVKKIEGNKLVRDIETVKLFHQYVNEEVQKQDYNFKIEYTEPFANLLICPTENTKQKAFQTLIKDYPKHLNIFITDDALDKPSQNEIDYFFVVGNASNEAKEMANYVASENITKGVEEILLKIDTLIK